jgi:hypothetical protein
MRTTDADDARTTCADDVRRRRAPTTRRLPSGRWALRRGGRSRLVRRLRLGNGLARVAAGAAALELALAGRELTVAALELVSPRRHWDLLVRSG